MPQIVPTQAVPGQTITVQLGSQPTRLNICQQSTGLFMDVLANDALVVAGALCAADVPIVRTAYLGFVGDPAFFDTQPAPLGSQADPDCTGLGARWPLYYLAPGSICASRQALGVKPLGQALGVAVAPA
jgi:hypothetical protein